MNQRPVFLTEFHSSWARKARIRRARLRQSMSVGSNTTCHLRIGVLPQSIVSSLKLIRNPSFWIKNGRNSSKLELQKPAKSGFLVSKRIGMSYKLSPLTQKRLKASLGNCCLTLTSWKSSMASCSARISGWAKMLWGSGRSSALRFARGSGAKQLSKPLSKKVRSPKRTTRYLVSQKLSRRASLAWKVGSIRSLGGPFKRLPPWGSAKRQNAKDRLQPLKSWR